MKRTRYFINFTSGTNALKRITPAGKVEFWTFGNEPADRRWSESCYDEVDLNDKSTFKQLTRDEARKIHSSAFRSPKRDKTQDPAPKVGTELAKKIRKVLDGIDYTGSQKIRAIKAIRAASTNDWKLVPVPGTTDYICGANPAFGLAEAKITVENFDKFVEFVETHNEMPHIGWDFRQPFTKRQQPVNA